MFNFWKAFNTSSWIKYMVFLSYFTHAQFSKICDIFEGKYDRYIKYTERESNDQYNDLAGNKAADILISKLIFCCKKLVESRNSSTIYIKSCLR